MQTNDCYHKAVIAWFEEMIKCELPNQTKLNVSAARPERTEVDARLAEAPQMTNLIRDEFDIAESSFVHDLVVTCNWHEHTETCWKHLKAGQSRDDSHCRMRIDGSTQPVTEIDSEIGSVLLRRLHPRINNYNDLVIFLLQCNMDIKHIGSGPGAKALVFYITDYITKNGLSVHVGLDAIKYAIRRNDYHSDFTDDAAKE